MVVGGDVRRRFLDMSSMKWKKEDELQTTRDLNTQRPVKRVSTGGRGWEEVSKWEMRMALLAIYFTLGRVHCC